jgi:hypothetical protein
MLKERRKADPAPRTKKPKAQTRSVVAKQLEAQNAKKKRKRRQSPSQNGRRVHPRVDNGEESSSDSSSSSLSPSPEPPASASKVCTHFFAEEIILTHYVRNQPRPSSLCFSAKSNHTQTVDTR